ncbi:hypothetical protein KP509_10G050000 [Ceratopteris richardii]|uniref:Methenyltetrahydrofolate synthase domain-containing protein n=1 Tax=Ceratopteris richardii TaxID=49495 RepID=A0A8T2U1U4_CERRI|nr:hypothetical protein KP509_10G050000 [Ceratopteris richardii]
MVSRAMAISLPARARACAANFRRLCRGTSKGAFVLQAQQQAPLHTIDSGVLVTEVKHHSAGMCLEVRKHTEDFSEAKFSPSHEQVCQSTSESVSTSLFCNEASYSDIDKAGSSLLRLREEVNGCMNEVASSTEVGNDISNVPSSWKWAIRERIWALLERENIAMHPLPVHHRIPNFKGAPTAALELANCPEFLSATCINVNPDVPQKQVRFLTLFGQKKLLVPQVKLVKGFFSEIEVSSLPKGGLANACSADGGAKYGKQLGIDAKLKVDLIVIGSVAVDPKTGARLGTGKGFEDLEYAMLREIGAIDDSTPVATTVHDRQLVDDIPTEELCAYDVPVDIICTPTQVIYTRTSLRKPEGICWEFISPQKLDEMQVLHQFRKQAELHTGEKLPLGPSEVHLPCAEKKEVPENSGNNARIFIWNLSRSTKWTDLKNHILSLGIEVEKVSIVRKGRYLPVARVLLREGTNVESAVQALDWTELGDMKIRVQMDSTSK